ncbi:unnamed protein product [Brassica napus]|uniref:(rape) hypothetical protein n=1 Tax=Brassica napus TaxID=3708 RepID=A0A816UFI3_BRANA|nr:unnamed protein product [Brassica napus]
MAPFIPGAGVWIISVFVVSGCEGLGLPVNHDRIPIATRIDRWCSEVCVGGIEFRVYLFPLFDLLKP